MTDAERDVHPDDPLMRRRPEPQRCAWGLERIGRHARRNPSAYARLTTPDGRPGIEVGLRWSF